jgi:rhodanese-related sulfurtransferase
VTPLRALVVFVGLFPAGCATDTTAAEARRLAQAGARLLDVRSPDEFRERHLPGAINVPIEELGRRLGELDRGRALIVYCHTGVRAGIAVELLRKAGFRRVHNLGSIGRWASGDADPPPLF